MVCWSSQCLLGAGLGRETEGVGEASCLPTLPMDCAAKRGGEQRGRAELGRRPGIREVEERISSNRRVCWTFILSSFQCKNSKQWGEITVFTKAGMQRNSINGGENAAN